MRILNKIKSIIGLWLGLTIVIHAQSNSLWIQDGYGESGTGGNPVGIVLANDDVLGGFQFDLTYDHSLIQFEEVIVAGHIAGMDLYTSEPEPGILTVVVVSLNGELIIPRVSMILEIKYFVQGNNQNEPVLLGLTNVVFSDTEGNTVSGGSADGFFFVEGVNVLKLENGFDSIPVDLYNDFSAGGVQFTLSYDSNIISLDSVATTFRSEEMDLSFNEISSGMVTILLYSFDQITIPPGSGPVLNLLFENISEEYSSIALDLSNVSVSNEQGYSVDVDYYGGTYFSLSVPLLSGPTAGFNATPTSGNAPLTVGFTDASVAGDGAINNWSWDFDGDGVEDTSGTGSHTHTYTLPGIYHVSLIVTDEYNFSDTLMIEAYIMVIPSVYPGDTNNDGFVNESDVLPLGIYFYLTGPPRTTVGYNWSQSSPDSSWNPVAATYADANGDGIINERDLFGIGLNWGITHTNGSKRFVIDPNDSTLLTLHKSALENLYQALGGDGEPTQQMKLLLERILVIEHIPDQFYLYQNYPNPFNPSTTIKFDLQDKEYVMLNIFDIGGRLVETLFQNKLYQGGTHAVTLHADKLSNGLYFYQITAGKWQSTQKMIILK